MDWARLARSRRRRRGVENDVARRTVRGMVPRMHRRWQKSIAFVVGLASCAPAVPATFPGDSPASEHAQPAPLPTVASALRSDPTAGWPGIAEPNGGIMMMDGGMMHHEGMHHGP